MSDALGGPGPRRRATAAASVVAAIVAVVATSGFLVASSAPAAISASPIATRTALAAGALAGAPARPGSRVLITTTTTTVHAAGSSIPGWGLVFLLAMFVVAVTLALPGTRRRRIHPRGA